MGAWGESQFAVELNKALAASGKSIDTVLRELDEAGFAVPKHALENWLKGYFLPRSEAAGEVVFALGTILGTTPGLLVQALAVDIASGKSFVPGEGVRSLKAASAEVIDGVLDRKFANSDEETDWASELIRVALEDHITMSEDLRDISHRVITWARVPAAPNPSLNAPVVYEAMDVPTHRRMIYDIEGAQLAGQKVYEMEDGLVNITSRLVLPPDVQPGELHRVAFTCDYGRNSKMNRATERFFPWPLEHYTCRVTFPGIVPEKIEYVFHESVGEGEGPELLEPQITLLEPSDGVVEIVRDNLPKGIGWVQWA